MSRRRIAAANWKMNKSFAEAELFVERLLEDIDPNKTEGVNIVLAPPYIHLQNLVEMLTLNEGIAVAAQNCHHEAQGAYTGEVSASMLKSIDVDAVLVGHSERRQYFGENDMLVSKKIHRALENDLMPVYCCGETLEQRESGAHLGTVTHQIEAALTGLSAQQMQQLVIAYEPVWAIGTGKTATVEQAGEMHQHIRSVLERLFGKESAESTSILYGGSVKASNAAELFAHPHIDGALVGGASLDPEEFLAIVYALASKRP